jgi:hypothetical protein
VSCEVTLELATLTVNFTHTSSIGADFAGATGASAPAQFLQRGLSPLTYDAARDGRGGREGGKGGEAEGRDIQPPHT